MLAWFGLIMVPHSLLTLAGRRDIVPPVFLAGIGWIAGLRVSEAGRPAPGRLLLLANHLSWLDILALAGSARAVFVAHAGLAEHGFLAWLCRQNDTVFITRDRRATVAGQIDQVGAALSARRVVLFPEATTGDGRALLAFKSSLLTVAEMAESEDEDLSIQPVALDYGEAAAIAWHGTEPGMRNVMRVLGRLRPVRLTIRYLPPLAGPDLVDRKAMARAAQAAIEESLRL